MLDYSTNIFPIKLNSKCSFMARLINTMLLVLIKAYEIFITNSCNKKQLPIIIVIPSIKLHLYRIESLWKSVHSEFINNFVRQFFLLLNIFVLANLAQTYVLILLCFIITFVQHVHIWTFWFSLSLSVVNAIWKAAADDTNSLFLLGVITNLLGIGNENIYLFL